MEKHPEAAQLAPDRTVAEGSSVINRARSRAAESEFSKSLVDAVLYGPIYVRSIEEDLDLVESISSAISATRSAGLRAVAERDPSRRILSTDRSLGSVIKAAHANPANPQRIQRLAGSIRTTCARWVFVIKRFYRADWGDDWRRHFHVDIINGAPGHELKYGERRLVGSYLRVGLQQTARGALQAAPGFLGGRQGADGDDITASVVVPPRSCSACPGIRRPSEPQVVAKLRVPAVFNARMRRFTRASIARRGRYVAPGLFVSNFQPLSSADSRKIVEDVAVHVAFTVPMRDHVSRNAARGDDGYAICSAKPRLVGGKPSKNPRYLQVRPDVSRPRESLRCGNGRAAVSPMALPEPVIFPSDQRALRSPQ